MPPGYPTGSPIEMRKKMQGYTCVYRHFLPSKADWDKTCQAALLDPTLDKFLGKYNDQYYDWGDDPSFFAAREFLGNVRHASWGVCRRNVRQHLKPGGLVVFFCAKPQIGNAKVWDYYYIGFGTVRATIDRWQLWQDNQFSCYRRFYNVLAEPKNSKLVQKETFHPYHKDWQKRLTAPYILFEPSEELSHFNLVNPLLVASYDGNKIPEDWGTSCLALQLENLLFEERLISRRLRSSPTGYGHSHINLTNEGKTTRPGRTIEQLRHALLELSETIFNTGNQAA